MTFERRVADRKGRGANALRVAFGVPRSRNVRETLTFRSARLILAVDVVSKIPKQQKHPRSAEVQVCGVAGQSPRPRCGEPVQNVSGRRGRVNFPESYFGRLKILIFRIARINLDVEIFQGTEIFMD